MLHCKSLRHVWKHRSYTSLTVSGPHEVYGIDFWDPTIESYDMWRYILTVVDLFHGYVRLFPTKTKSAQEVMYLLHNYIFSHLGLPKMIFSDDDPAFKSNEVQEYCRVTGLEWPRTAPHSHWQLGRVERRHQDLGLAMKTLEDKSLWSVALPGMVARALNTLELSTTGISPAEVEYGYSPREPLHAALTDGKAEIAGIPNLSEVSEQHRKRLFQHLKGLEAAHRSLRTVVRIVGDHNRQKDIDAKNNQSLKPPPEIKVGQLVVCYRPTRAKGQTETTQSQWSGPWRVEDIRGGKYHCVMGSKKCAVSRSNINLYAPKIPTERNPTYWNPRSPQDSPLTTYDVGDLVLIGDHGHDELERGNFNFISLKSRVLWTKSQTGSE